MNNQLRYVRIGNRQLRFTGNAADLDKLQPGCGYKLTSCPCFCYHTIIGTYKTAYNQYIDNHIEWLPEGHNPGGMERSLAEGALAAVGSASEAMGSLGSSMGSMFGGGSAKVAPEPTPASGTG